ncbi:MAG TPA: hypothetical protein VHH88_05530, partial [Verrucomicrobiae bacterium]|nr:hypothetical protein [Verrucomicrobiae bacterium]
MTQGTGVSNVIGDDSGTFRSVLLSIRVKVFVEHQIQGMHCGGETRGKRGTGRFARARSEKSQSAFEPDLQRLSRDWLRDR